MSYSNIPNTNPNYTQTGGGYYIQPGSYYSTPGTTYNTPIPVMTLPQQPPEQDVYMKQLQHAREIISKPERAAMGSLQLEPQGITFSSQNPKEVVFILLRAHAITNLGWLTRALIWGVFPIILIAVLTALGFRLDTLPIISDLFSDIVLYEIVALMIVIYYSLIITTSFMSFVDWYYNIYLITNERAIDFDFKSLVSYKILEARLDNIENVKEKSVGLLPSIFNYGDIFIQTAAQNIDPFDFLSVPAPTRVRDIIADLANYARRLYGRSFRENA